MAAVCESCSDPLVLKLEPSTSSSSSSSSSSGDDDDEGAAEARVSPQTVPDDVCLKRCGHHFHFDCLLAAYTATVCPACNVDVTEVRDGAQRILCDLNNEGGPQHDQDILPLLAEGSYLRAYPEERRARAFQEFCSQGDIDGVISVLQDGEDEGETAADVMSDGPPVDVLRYQDPMADQRSCLQAVVMGPRTSSAEQIAWLLLFLASVLPLDQFPQELVHLAQSMGFTRRDMDVKTDIRAITDTNGRTAAEYAAGGGLWDEWIANERLSVA